MGFFTFFAVTLIPVHFALMYFFIKAGKKGLYAWIPIYNYYLLAKITERPVYWIIGLFMPGLNLITFFAFVTAFLRSLGFHKTKDLLIYAAAYPYFLLSLARNPSLKIISKKDQIELPKNKLREYFEAAMYAFVLVQGIKTYIAEPFHIPTSSMEDQLLVGDLVVVSKFHFGARVPLTPLTFPLMHNSFLWNGTSWAFLEWWKGPELRLPGLKKVERNDIVVFSFPVNDTMVVDDFLKAHSYYDQVYRIAENIMIKDFSAEAVQRGITPYESFIQKRLSQLSNVEWDYYVSKARTLFLNEYQVKAMPVDKKENFIKRCVAIPGDTLQIINGLVHINSSSENQPDRLVYRHLIYLKPNTYLEPNWMIDQGVSKEDMTEINESQPIVKLTLYQADLLRKRNNVDSVIRVLDAMGNNRFHPPIYPNHPQFQWSQDNFGPLWIPQKGSTIKLSSQNIALYRRCIEAYEGNKLEFEGDDILINGTIANEYTFGRDYYFMMGDNRHGSLDSRFWGFVPDNHIVGTSFVVLGSLNKDKKGFLRSIRSNRFLYLPE
jgi:signal peptidase I